MIQEVVLDEKSNNHLPLSPPFKLQSSQARESEKAGKMISW